VASTCSVAGLLYSLQFIFHFISFSVYFAIQLFIVLLFCWLWFMLCYLLIKARKSLFYNLDLLF